LVEAIPATNLDPDAAGELGFARALLLSQTGNTALSLEQASRTVKELEARNASNLVVVHLQSGLGSLRSREGQYEDAVHHFEQALLVAQRLGNDTMCTNVIANLSLCLARLGKYAEQGVWAAKASSFAGPEFTGFAEVQLTYSLALGYAMQNRPLQA